MCYTFLKLNDTITGAPCKSKRSKYLFFWQGVFLLEGDYMKPKIYKLESNQRYTAVHISEEEIELLRYIHEFKSVHTHSIHHFYKSGLRRDSSGNAITNRLSKLVKSGVLHQLNDNVQKRDIFKPINYAYRLSTRGYDLLHELGFITEEEVESGKRNRRIFMPTSHNRVVSTLFMELVERLKLHGETFESLKALSCRGDRHESLSSADKKSGVQPIVPDWVFETRDHIICLELDTGSQAHSVIQNKFYRYKMMMQDIQKPLVIVFSVGLISDMEGEVPTRDKRVASLKEIFPESKEWPDGLDIFVVPTTRTVDILYRLLKQPSDLGRLHYKKVVNQWIINSLDTGERKVSFKNSREESLQRMLFQDQNDLDMIAEIKSQTSLIYGGLLYMEEGAVRSYQRAKANMKRIQTWNVRRAGFESKTMLLLIYDENINLENDVVALSPLCETFLISNELVKSAAEKNKYPLFTEMVSQFTQKERELI